MSDKVLVLNATYEPLNVCSARRAIVLVLKQKAEAIEASGRVFHSAESAFPLPAVIRLSCFVRVPHGKTRRVSRRAVLARDRHSCQYCGSRFHLTIDHIIPRSRGGESTWENIVTSCAPCNSRKGDRMPFEANMRLRSKPRPPDPIALICMAVNEIHLSWKRYLDYAVA